MVYNCAIAVKSSDLDDELGFAASQKGKEEQLQTELQLRNVIPFSASLDEIFVKDDTYVITYTITL